MSKKINKEINICSERTKLRFEQLKKMVPKAYATYDLEKAFNMYFSLVFNSVLRQKSKYKSRDEIIERVETQVFNKILNELKEYREKLDLVYSVEEMFGHQRCYEFIINDMLDVLHDELSLRIGGIIEAES